MPEITFQGDRGYYGDSTLAFPSNPTTGIQAHFGPSFTATIAPVPEPASWRFLGAGLLALAGIVRRRRQAA
jgi:hypothetical protein